MPDTVFVRESHLVEIEPEPHGAALALRYGNAGKTQQFQFRPHNGGDGIFNGLDKAENGASVSYLPVYIYFPVPWATYRPEIWAAYEAKDRDSLKVEYEKVMYDYMDDWLTNGNNSENRGTSWGQYKSRLEKGMGIDIGLTARETGFYETNYFYGGATATEQRASSTLSDTATSFIIEYIMGQKTEADWESFKQSWNDMGGADWTKEVNEQYKSIAG